MSEDHSDPAFPFVCNDLSKNQCTFSGVTLRDYFAAKAMQGIIASGGVNVDDSERFGFTTIEKAAYVHADAMLAARSKS